MSINKRSLKMEKLARIYDAEVMPVWSERFGKMLLRGLEVPAKGQVLDVACGTGYPAVEIIRRMSESCRLIAIDAASAMLDVARKKIDEVKKEVGRRSVFFRTESAAPKLSFADDVYDLVVCNLGISEMGNIGEALADFARVTTPGGQLRVTLPLAGTFQEFFDIYREVLIKHDKHEALDRLNVHLQHAYPTVDDCYQWVRACPLDDLRVEVEEFSMLFKSSREFFFAPVIEYGPLSEWKRIAGEGQEMQDVFWYIKEAIDAYFGGRAFEVTVKAGLIVGTKVELTDDIPTGQIERIDLADDDVLEEREDSEVVELKTDEIDIKEIGQSIADFEADDEVEIDAFVEGRQRPSHLDFPDE